MKTLVYSDLNTKKIPNFTKVQRFLEADDFQSAEVKKVGDNLYRARLDRSNRLLFAIYRYQDVAYILLLEWIANHAYDKSRFLKRGATIDEDKISIMAHPPATAGEPLTYLNSKLKTFNFLDKVISFDGDQDAVFKLQPPMIVIGSAGSGKTALTLEKMKEAPGDVLYVTRSAYLVHNSRNLYYALDYENDAQSVDFLSFEEFLSSIKVPDGEEMPYREFIAWFGRHRQASGLKDPQQLYEEFKGVITGPSSNQAYLTRQDYLDLGIKQSIFSPDERVQVYDLFGKYLDYMAERHYYDANIVSFHYKSLVQPRYDFVIVDEVQDLTNIQLQLILGSLVDPFHFILCGDSNQIVHPNFFSWSQLKTFFYQQDANQRGATDLIRILRTNYRNSPEITEIANRILKLKNARFGSIDKESNYLVRSNATEAGRMLLLSASGALTSDLNERTYQSTRFAVIVMHPDQKAEARKHFQTPLIFAIHEVKGLEYESIILYNFTTDDADRFREITRGVNPEDLRGDELVYARSRDKSDKSLEIYKFYINSLYVAVTRAVRNIFMVEEDCEQPLFALLGLTLWEGELDLDEQGSSLEEWRVEAHKLELQGKQDQASEIRSQILKLDEVPWEVLAGENLAKLEQEALEANNKKAKLLLFEYALVYTDRNRMNALVKVKFRPALQPKKDTRLLNQKYFIHYQTRNPAAMTLQLNRYGVDFRNQFNQTPLMIAARLGNSDHVAKLMNMDADRELVNNVGFNAFQVALEQATEDRKYCTSKLAAIYELLAPESIVIEVNGKLIKVDNHLMEFLMFNLMVAMFYTRLGEKASIMGEGYTTADFLNALENFPNSIVPERRKKRAYLSSILSKNEVSRQGKYNRKLFRRMKHGHYIINPRLAVRVGGEWRNIYDLLSLDHLGYSYREPHFDATYQYDPNYWRERDLADFRARVRSMRELKDQPDLF